MSTFNPSSPPTSDETTILELREDEFPRARAMSQENIARNDQSELLETKTVMSHLGGGYALSQYVCPRSVYNDDEDVTESEHDDDLEPFVSEQKLRLRKVLASVQPSMSLYQRFIEWAAQNEVTTKAKHTEMLDQIRKAQEERARKEAELEFERQRQLEFERLKEERRL